MAGIDKAAIGFSIAIVAIGVAFAMYGDATQNAGPSVSTPTVSNTVEPVMEEETVEPVMEEETVELYEELKVEESHDTEDVHDETPAGPTTHTVEIPAGTSVPGCEETNACYSPADITINAGDTVEWVNVDTAAHTVTGGSPADGPSGVFDSSLVMANADYAFTFDDAGSYDYFCMVHPWMVGSVTVN